LRNVISERPLVLYFIFRYENFKGNYFNINLFGEIFHDLCDAIEIINNLFAIHLVPILTFTLIVDIFGIYVAFHNSPLFANIIFNFVTAYFAAKNYILRAMIAYIGITTTREPEILIEFIAKLLNKLPQCHPQRCMLHDCMKEFHVRSFNLRTFFLTINWNILLGVKLRSTFFMSLTFNSYFFSGNINNSDLFDYSVSYENINLYPNINFIVFNFQLSISNAIR